MKSILSQFFKSSLFNHVMRLAIVVVCLSYSAAAAAAAGTWTPKWTLTAGFTSESTGRGKVYVSTSASTPKETEWQTTTHNPTINGQSLSTTSNPQTSKTFYWHAQGGAGYYFRGWYTNQDGSELHSSDNPYKESITATVAINQNPKQEYYASFGDLRDVNVTMLAGEQPSTYTAKTSGSNKTYTIKDQNIVFDYDEGNGEFLQAADLKVVLTHKTSPAGQRFYAWRITENGVTKDYNRGSTAAFTHTFTSSATVQPIYIPNDYAMYAVGNDYLTLYADLNEAIELAKNAAPKVVTVMVDGKLDTRETKSYTIPDGVTLLVPGEDTYCYRVGGIQDEDIRGSQTFKKFVKFTLPTGSELNVASGGGLSVYAYLATQTLHPGGYGQIDLESGAQINIKQGGVATIYGFITGDPEESKVVVESDGTIYETLRMLDWRGGTITLDIKGNKERVFPINQFYVQNVETTLELQNGATENISMATTISSMLLKADAAFIVTRDGTSNQPGFLQMGSNTTVRKYLDKTTDKMIFIVSSEGSSMTEPEETVLGNVNLNLGSVLGQDASINSSDYVLPIPNHMAIQMIENTVLRVKHPALLLAGSYIHVDFSSLLCMANGAYLVVYDNEQHEVYLDKALADAVPIGWYNYYGSANKEIVVNDRQPSRSYKREIQWNSTTDADGDGKVDKNSNNQTITTTTTVKSWGDLQMNKRVRDLLDENAWYADYISEGGFVWKEDAKLIIDGYLEGEVYTTEDGATITSNGGGKLKLINQVSTRKSYQIVQNSNENCAFALVPLSEKTTLRNEDQSIVPAEQNKTYVYYKPNDDVEGLWKEPEVDLLAIENNHFDIFVPEPYQQVVECKVETQVEGLSNFSFDIERIEGTAFEYETPEFNSLNSIVTIPLTYTPQSYIHGREYSEEITLVISFTDLDGNTASVKRPFEITTKEDYIPIFELKIGEQTYTMQDGEDGTYSFADFRFSGVNPSAPVQVIPIEPNITTSSHVTWKADVDNPFAFDNETSTISFEPTFAASFDKLFTYTAMYDNGTPANTADDISRNIQVRLKAKSILQDNPFKLKLDNISLFKGNTLTLLKSDLFDNMGNNATITHDFSNSYLQITEQDDRYIIKGLNVIETTAVVFNQQATDIMEAKTCTLTVEVKPEVKFNWKYLYYNNTAYDPIDTENTGWTLSVKNPIDDCASLVTLTKVDGVYQAQVGAPANPETECAVTFVYQQGSSKLEFGPIPMFEDPKILPFCLGEGVDAQRIYESVTIPSETKNVRLVTVDGNDNDYIEWTNVDENNHPQWTIQFLGVADKLSLQLLSGGRTGEWIIEDVTNSTPSTLFAESLNSNTLELPLYATTEKLRITYYSETHGEQVKMKDICISKLQISSTTNKIYLPIELQDDDSHQVPSHRVVTITYAVDAVGAPVKIVDSKKQSVSSITVDYTTLPNQDGKRVIEQQITITNNSCKEEGDYYLVVDNGELEIPIRTHFYPMPLPVISSDWVSNKKDNYYYYLWGDPNNVEWNSPNILLKPTLGNGNRYVTFVFKGGPHTMSFDVQSEITKEKWNQWGVEQSADGDDWSPVSDEGNLPTITVNAAKTHSTIEMPTLKYTSKYIRIVNNEEVSLSVNNLRVEGIPAVDVDVPFEGHYAEEGIIDTHVVMDFKPGNVTLPIEVMAINLKKLEVELEDPDMFKLEYNGEDKGAGFVLDNTHPAIGEHTVGRLPLQVTWNEKSNVDESRINFYHVIDTNQKELLATINLVGAQDVITILNATETGVWTGINPDEVDKHPFQDLTDDRYKYGYKQINLANTFDEEGNALFDYLVVYGETTADTGKEITEPTKTRGSNAKTPYSIYKKTGDKQYQLVHYAFNANQGEKEALHSVVDAEGNKLIPHAEETDATQYINIGENQQLRVYMTGFCPYASTGFDKAQEGVWLFRAKKNAKLDVYLEDCHIYSRDKTRDGHEFEGKFDPNADYFQDYYARGSGAVLVFECNQKDEYLDSEAFQVNIHTRGKNLLKSNHGCFFEIMGVRAYQVSSPLQIRMTSDQFYPTNSKTHLTLDDKWPTSAADYAQFVRTNGFISLQKKNNNAPSIDMGNGNTVVNFRGGQVELQNAQNVSDKYKTTLAISYRSGIMAAGGVEIQMAYGLGTDAATEGTVKFYDGTITVIPMQVDVKDRKYYLMDPKVNAAGDTIKDANGNIVYSDITSCLRCPEKTYVYGGSICMLRACMSPTSQGGAPTDGKSLLGRFFYTEEHGFTYHACDAETEKSNPQLCKLVTLDQFPHNTEIFGSLNAYYSGAGYEKGTYGRESITPNKKGQVILWLPENYGGVTVEKDRYLTPWKACMPEIEAILAKVGTTEIGGTVGGPTAVENLEDVDNLLYCQMDEHIYEVISETTGEGEDERYVYEAPLKVPDGFNLEGVDLGLGDYLRLAPSHVAETIDEHEMENQEDYNINSKVYYVSSATADLWQTFTAPFDVERIWIVETFDETALSQIKVDTEKDPQGMTKRNKILKTQATHNADFASFFGVAMALGSEKDFEGIFAEYLDWAAFVEDKHQGNINDYTKRGKVALIPYDGTNWRDAHFYLYHNKGNWTIQDAENSKFVTQWDYVQKEGNVLLEKGETYSMFFPYANDWGEYDQSTRPFWDYWSGKLLIFESTQASKENPHVMRGSNYVAATKPAKGDWIFPSADVTEDPTEAIVTGNSTFAHMQTDRSDLFIYAPMEGAEGFYPLESEQTILPTETFLLANPPKNGAGMPARGIKRTGEIIYDKHGTSDVGHIPTVGGGHDLFITSIEGGINVAVAAPQYVRVLSSTGSVIYSGMIQTALDIQLPSLGMYVVSGEKEVQKVMY